MDSMAPAHLQTVIAFALMASVTLAVENCTSPAMTCPKFCCFKNQSRKLSSFNSSQTCCSVCHRSIYKTTRFGSRCHRFLISPTLMAVFGAVCFVTLATARVCCLVVWHRQRRLSGGRRRSNGRFSRYDERLTMQQQYANRYCPGIPLLGQPTLWPQTYGQNPQAYLSTGKSGEGGDTSWKPYLVENSFAMQYPVAQMPGVQYPIAQGSFGQYQSYPSTAGPYPLSLSVSQFPGFQAGQYSETRNMYPVAQRPPVPVVAGENTKD